MATFSRGFNIKSNTGFFGEKYRRAGLIVAAQGLVYPFGAVTAPAYSFLERAW